MRRLHLFVVNGSRYEGSFTNGKKNGEGVYYHNKTGQIQKGMWVNDVCKTSLVFDEFRNQVQNPTKYAIQEVSSTPGNRSIWISFRKM